MTEPLPQNATLEIVDKWIEHAAAAVKKLDAEVELSKEIIEKGRKEIGEFKNERVKLESEVEFKKLDVELELCKEKVDNCRKGLKELKARRIEWFEIEEEVKMEENGKVKGNLKRD